MKFLLIFLYLIFIQKTLSQTPNIMPLNERYFVEFIYNSRNTWLILFCVTWSPECLTFMPEFELTAKQLENSLKFGTVDCDDEKNLAKIYNVVNYPTVYLFPAESLESLLFKGNNTATDLLDFIASKTTTVLYNTNSQNGFDVINITDYNVKENVYNSNFHWMIQFYIPDCHDCEELRPHWTKAAAELQGKVKFGQVNLAENRYLKKRILERNFPSIRYFPPDADIRFLGVEYDGSYDYKSIIQWTSNIMFNISNPDIVEITNEGILINTCHNVVLCIITILPKINQCPTMCRIKYLNILKNAAINLKSKFWGYLWSVEGDQIYLEQALQGPTAHKYPKLFAVNWLLRTCAEFNGNFSEKTIMAFLIKVYGGKEPVYVPKADSIPYIRNVQPWNWKDSDTPVIEHPDNHDESEF